MDAKVFLEQRAAGTLLVWANPFKNPRISRSTISANGMVSGEQT
jgi:hypothetical protein